MGTYIILLCMVIGTAVQLSALRKRKKLHLPLSLFFLCILACNPSSRQQDDASLRDSAAIGENAGSDHQDTELQALMLRSKRVLEKQLAEGANTYNTYHELQKEPFTTDDLKAFAFEAKNILWNNGHLEWENEHFAQTIKEIFGASIPTDSSASYTYINLLNPCLRKTIYRKNDGINHNGIFIITPENFISDFYYLPEIMDYRMEHPELAEKETVLPDHHIDTVKGTKVSIEKWMDLENRNDEYSLSKQRTHNRMLILYRNRFLFGRDASVLEWLVQHDATFMKSLVKRFGWTNNEKLLYWVITVTPFDNRWPDDFGSLFWFKDCTGNVTIHTNTFKLLQRHYSEDAEHEFRDVLDNISGYLDYMMDRGDTYPDITREQQVEILANMVYFAEQYKYKKLANGRPWSQLRMMGRLRYYLSLEGNERYSTILEARNYFGLPKFKEWWDAADYDEYYMDGEWNGPWGRDNEPLTEQEWRAGTSGSEYN